MNKKFSKKNTTKSADAVPAISTGNKRLIKQFIKKLIQEYGQTLKLLSKE